MNTFQNFEKLLNASYSINLLKLLYNWNVELFQNIRFEEVDRADLATLTAPYL